MEALISQFTFLSPDKALQQDKNYDPSRIDEELMRLFEIESYKAWAGGTVELEQEKKEVVEEADSAIKQQQDVMESIMDEFRCFEEELEKMSIAELDEGLVENAAAIAFKRYIEAAMSSATASMKSAWKGLSSSAKLHSS